MRCVPPAPVEDSPFVSLLEDVAIDYLPQSPKLHYSSSSRHSAIEHLSLSLTLSLSLSHSLSLSLTHTHMHTDTQTHRHTDTQTHRHTDTQTHRHTDTQTHTPSSKPRSWHDTNLRSTAC